MDLYVGYAQSSRLFKNIGTKYKPLFQAQGSIVDESLLDENVNQIRVFDGIKYSLRTCQYSSLCNALQFSSGGYLDEDSPAVDNFEPTHFAIGDLDDDGAQDILMSTGSGDLIFQPSAVQPPSQSLINLNQVNNLSVSKSSLVLTTSVEKVDNPSSFSGDLSGKAEENTPIQGHLKADDLDGLPERNAFSVASTGEAEHGTVAVDPDTGRWTYIPSDYFPVMINL